MPTYPPGCCRCDCEDCRTGNYRDFYVRSAIDGEWWCSVCWQHDVEASDSDCERPPFIAIMRDDGYFVAMSDVPAGGRESSEAAALASDTDPTAT